MNKEAWILWADTSAERGIHDRYRAALRALVPYGLFRRLPGTETGLPLLVRTEALVAGRGRAFAASSVVVAPLRAGAGASSR
jgi:hypothetical protein